MRTGWKGCQLVFPSTYVSLLNGLISFLLTRIREEGRALTLLLIGQQYCCRNIGLTANNYCSHSPSLESVLNHPEVEKLLKSLGNTRLKKDSLASLSMGLKDIRFSQYDTSMDLLKLSHENENLRRALEAEKTLRLREEAYKFILVQAIKEVEQDLDSNGLDSITLTEVIQKLDKKLNSYTTSQDKSTLSRAIMDIYNNQLRRETARESGPLSLTLDYNGQWNTSSSSNPESTGSSKIDEQLEQDEQSLSEISLGFKPMLHINYKPLNRELHVVHEVDEEEEEAISLESNASEAEEFVEQKTTQVINNDNFPTFARMVGNLLSRVDRIVTQVTKTYDGKETDQPIETNQFESDMETLKEEKGIQTQESNEYLKEIEFLRMDVQALKSALNKQTLELVEAKEKLREVESTTPKSLTRLEDELRAWKELVEQQKQLLSQVIVDNESERLLHSSSIDLCTLLFLSLHRKTATHSLLGAATGKQV